MYISLLVRLLKQKQIVGVEAREKGLEMVEEPDEEDFSVEEVECYKVSGGDDKENG